VKSAFAVRFPLDVLGLPGAIFSDGNTRDGNTKFFLFETVENLAALDAGSNDSASLMNLTSGRKLPTSAIG